MTDLQDANFDSRKWGFIGLLFGIPVFILGANFGHPDKGLAAGLSVAMLILVGRGYWSAKTKIWYWATIGVALLLHCSAVVFVHFDRLPGPTLLVLWPFALVDLIALLMLFKSAQKLAVLMGRQNARS